MKARLSGGLHSTSELVDLIRRSTSGEKGGFIFFSSWFPCMPVKFPNFFHNIIHSGGNFKTFMGKRINLGYISSATGQMGQNVRLKVIQSIFNMHKT